VKTELNELLEFAVDLARGAGEITLQYFRKHPETSTKSDGSYVTIADREAESYLRKQIAERFPEDGILGEEEGELQGSSGRRWILDPIDGTFAFVHGVPFYGVLIAVEIEGEMSVGVVNIPVIHFSVEWWNTLHQPASVTRLGKPAIHISILIPLLIMMLAFKLYFVTVALMRSRNELVERERHATWVEELVEQKS
jgi:fructose-1,6-bisphosphatase/inositol monophosphatase family enzyme